MCWLPLHPGFDASFVFDGSHYDHQMSTENCGLLLWTLSHCSLGCWLSGKLSYVCLVGVGFLVINKSKKKAFLISTSVKIMQSTEKFNQKMETDQRPNSVAIDPGGWCHSFIFLWFFFVSTLSFLGFFWGAMLPWALVPYWTLPVCEHAAPHSV